MAVIANTAETIVVLSKKGLLVPEFYLREVYKRGYDTYVSVTTGNGGKTQDILETTRVPGVPLEDLLAFQKKMENREVVLAFGKHDVLADEDIQPFELVKDKLGCFLFGDFAEWAKGNEHSAYYNCFKEYLSPKISQLLELSGGDFNKTLELMSKEMFVREIRNLSPEGGVIFMIDDGQVCPITRPATLLSSDNTFGWGWTTHTLGQNFDQEPSKAGKKVLSLGDREEPDLSTEQQAADKVEEAKTDDAGFDVFAPDKNTSRKQRKAFYRGLGWTNNLPEGWERGVAVPKLGKDGKPVRKEVIKSFDQLEAVTGEDGKTVIKQKENAEDRSEGPVPIHKPSEPDPKAQNIPTLSRTSIQIGKDFLNSGRTKAIVDFNNRRLEKDPNLLNESVETDVPSFFTEMGIDVLETIRWPYEVFKNMAKLDSNLIAKLAWSAINLIKMGYKTDELRELLFPQGKKAKEDLPIPEGLPQDDEPSSDPQEPAPVKVAAFGGRPRLTLDI